MFYRQLKASGGIHYLYNHMRMDGKTIWALESMPKFACGYAFFYAPKYADIQMTGDNGYTPAKKRHN